MFFQNGDIWNLLPPRMKNPHIRILVCLMLLFSVSRTFGQYDPNYKRREERDESSGTATVNLGLGLGLNYGGFGGRLELSPIKNFAVFAAAGFNLHTLGFNVGAKARAAAEKKVSPILQFMYGYNGVILIVGASEHNKTYYGPSIGGGIELKLGEQGNFMEFGLILPFRDEAFYDDIRNLRRSGIDITEPIPVAISVGFHFKI
jgi:hypothetical protein